MSLLSILLVFIVVQVAADISTSFTDLDSPPRCFFVDANLPATTGNCLDYTGHTVVVHYYSERCLTKSETHLTKLPYYYACPHAEYTWSDQWRQSCFFNFFFKFTDDLPYESLFTRNHLCMIQPDPRNPAAMWKISGVPQYTILGSLDYTKRSQAAVRDADHPWITFVEYANRVVYRPETVPIFVSWDQPNGAFLQLDLSRFLETPYARFVQTNLDQSKVVAPVFNYTLFLPTHFGVRSWGFCSPDGVDDHSWQGPTPHPKTATITGLELGPATPSQTGTVAVWCGASFTVNCDMSATRYNDAGCPTHGLCPTNSSGIACSGNGLCTNQAQCLCLPGWTGVDCSVWFPAVLQNATDVDTWNSLLGFGSCAPALGGFYGAACGYDSFRIWSQYPEKFTVRCANFNPCDFTGTCQDGLYFPACTCDDSWFGNSSGDPTALSLPSNTTGEELIYYSLVFSPGVALYRTYLFYLGQSGYPLSVNLTTAATGVGNCSGCTGTHKICTDTLVCSCALGWMGTNCDVWIPDFISSMDQQHPTEGIWDLVALNTNCTDTVQGRATSDCAYAMMVNLGHSLLARVIVHNHLITAACNGHGTVDPDGGCLCESSWYGGDVELSEDVTVVAQEYMDWFYTPALSTWGKVLIGTVRLNDTTALLAYAKGMVALDFCRRPHVNVKRLSTTDVIQYSQWHRQTNACRIYRNATVTRYLTLGANRGGGISTSSAAWLAPAWYQGGEDLRIYTRKTGPDAPYSFQLRGRGYKCLDERALLTNRPQNPVLYGGPGCLPCPPCVTANSVCVGTNTTVGNTTRVCSCFENWSHGNNATNLTQTCDAPVCPWAASQEGPCGQNKSHPEASTGHCVWGNGTAPYLGHCSCYDGFTGVACEIMICPLGANGKMCSGSSSADARPIDVPDTNQTSRAFCNESTGTCECLPGYTSGSVADAQYWKVPNSTCSLVACKTDASGRECSGVTYAPQGIAGVSVCDRSPQNPTCQCQLAISPSQTSVDPNRFFGERCEHSYIEACSRDNATWCGSGVAATFVSCSVPVVTGVAFDPSRPPQCSCFPSALCPSDGSPCYCDQSQCDPTQNPLHACQYTSNNGSAFLSTGQCLPFKNGQPDETAIDSADWRCVCGAVHRATNLTCDLSRESTPALSDCVIYDFNPDSRRCDIPKPGCTYLSVTGNRRKLTLCNDLTFPNGQSVCVANQSDATQYFCTCPVDYYGQFCENRNTSFCGGLCTSPGARCVNNVCYCSPYFTGVNCDVDLCLSTGGSYDNVTASCNCPAGSAWIDSTHTTRTVQGCIKQCPFYNGYECGGEKDYSGAYRCSSRTTVANNTAVNLTCNCNNSGYPGDRVGVPGYFQPFVLDSITGSCQPYCLNGATYNPNTGLCTCPSTRYSGLRCNATVCNGKGVFRNGVCVCDNHLDDPATGCAQSLCQPPAAFASTNDSQRCACNAPYVPNPLNVSTPCISPCVNGSPNTITGTCDCVSSFWRGAYCDQTDCIVDATLTLTNCTCKNGGLWNATTLSCTDRVCGAGVPDGKGGCTCPSVFGGSHCELDRCKAFNGTAHRDLDTGNWLCACDPGYFAPLGGGLCTASFCDPGTPYRCGGEGELPCIYPHYAYNCRCGLSSWFISGECVTANECLYGTLMFNTSTQEPYCLCQNGYGGVRCDLPLCDFSNALIYFNVTTQRCSCIPPFSNPAGGCIDTSLCGTGGDPSNGPIPQPSDTSRYRCLCRSGYVLNDSVAGFPCVPVCDATGTLYALDSSCICQPYFTGEHCEIVPNTLVASTSSSSSSIDFPVWAIGVTAGGGAVVAVLIILVVYVWVLKKPFPSYLRLGRTRTR